jgi:hypothetical protein
MRKRPDNGKQGQGRAPTRHDADDRRPDEPAAGVSNAGGRSRDVGSRPWLSSDRDIQDRYSSR